METVTPLQRVKISQISNTPNLQDPYWQLKIAVQALRAATYKEPVTTDDDAEDDQSEDQDADDEDEAGDDSDSEQDALEELKGAETAHDINNDSLYYMDAETFDWQRELESSNAATIAPSAESVSRYNEQQEYFDNLNYQRENHEEACRNLGIQNPQRPRLPEMRISIHLKFWQPVAANALLEFEDNVHLKGCILADVVGLGKTWITITYLLAVSSSAELPRTVRSGKASQN